MAALKDTADKIADAMAGGEVMTAKRIANVIGAPVEYGVVSALRGMIRRGQVARLKQTGPTGESRYRLRVRGRDAGS